MYSMYASAKPQRTARLRCDALVVAADQAVGVVDGRAVHREPANGAQPPAAGSQIVKKTRLCKWLGSMSTVYVYIRLPAVRTKHSWELQQAVHLIRC